MRQYLKMIKHMLIKTFLNNYCNYELRFIHLVIYIRLVFYCFLPERFLRFVFILWRHDIITNPLFMWQINVKIMASLDNWHLINSYDFYSIFLSITVLRWWYLNHVFLDSKHELRYRWRFPFWQIWYVFNTLVAFT